VGEEGQRTAAGLYNARPALKARTRIRKLTSSSLCDDIQDTLMVSYLSSLVRSQVELAARINLLQSS
jgi:hypothetical protein